MKKLLICATLSALVCVVAVTSCKKKSDSAAPAATTYKCTNCITTPEAKAANDNLSKGIYKGVVVGSSGTIKFDIMNSDSTIKAYMVIDSVSVTLTASVAWTAGASYMSPFTGTMSGQPVSITFKIDMDGGNPMVTSMSIPGHPDATLSLSKETSTNLIECFEGTIKDITTGESGTFDLMLSKSLKKWGATVRVSGKTSSVSGPFDGTTLTLDDGKGSTGSATLTGDNITDGKWQNTKPENGTWTAKRTM